MIKPAKNVLIVEDDKSNALYLETVVRMFDANYHTTRDKMSALKALRSQSFDLILLDLRIPGGGVELLEEFRAEEGESGNTENPVPCIIATVERSKAIRERCELQGVSGFLVKPFHLESLKSLLQKHLLE